MCRDRGRSAPARPVPVGCGRLGAARRPMGRMGTAVDGERPPRTAQAACSGGAVAAAPAEAGRGEGAGDEGGEGWGAVTQSMFDRVPRLGAGLPSNVDGWEERGGLVVPCRKRPTGIDLFCGAGGFSLGFIEAGFEVVCGVDADPHAALTYLANLGAYPLGMRFVSDEDRAAFEKVAARQMKPPKGERLSRGVWSGMHRPPSQPGVGCFFLGDVRSLTGAQILSACHLKRGDVDCVFGGPPCQGFSRSGKRDVMDPRNSLVFEFARLVLEIQPKTICMENVPDIVRMVTPEGISVVDAFCRILQDGGFGTVDGLKRALLAHPTAGAAMNAERGESGIAMSTHRKENKPPRKGAAQASLFDAAAP